jgi:hypothetical protein
MEIVKDPNRILFFTLNNDADIFRKLLILNGRATHYPESEMETEVQLRRTEI